MKYLVFLFCFWILPIWAQTFLPGTEDIPQMNELTEVEELASFDNPAERMLLVGAKTKLSFSKVLEFYQESLSNLGWKNKGKGKFERGLDVFSIELNSDGDDHQIQFRLSQRNS